MSKFKVTNPDEPIEIDLYQDIPSKDPDTGIDQIDDEGNILVKRYVTRSINSKGIANIKNALPQINTNKEAIAALDKYAKDNVASITSDIGSINDNLLGTQTDLSDLTQTVSVLQGKINGIQGIDIDVVQADVDALKKSAYLITGGVLKGDVSIQTPNTAVLTLTPKGSSSYASFSTTNDVLDCTTTWGKVFKVSEEGKYFYGLADKATQDALGQNIADNYIKDITGANATLTITKGTGTTSILSVNNVLQAQKAIADKNNNDITTTYATKTENTSNLASAKAYADTKKNEAIASANSYTDQEKAKYLPLHSKADTAGTADIAGRIQSSLQTDTYINGNYGNVLVNSTAQAGSYVMLSRLHSTSGWFTHGIYLKEYLLQYTSQATVDTGTNTVDKSVTLLDESGNTSFCGNVSAPIFRGTLEGRGYPRNSSGGDINFHWYGKGGQPTWLWGGEDGINMYVYNPANFSVNYATYASRSANNGSFFISGYEISIG